MPVRTRTFRVFVSSTFTDMKEERNALQSETFPNLRKLCEKHGARFQAIDLRWGVRDEAAYDQKTMEICLREIERCQKTEIKPNFIILLGQRYGWRPLPARVEAQEFEAVRDRILGPDARALVDDWYIRDDNAVPPEYVLKPRTGKWVDRKRWEETEGRLHPVLEEAAGAARLSEQAMAKYRVSATHQEILKGLGPTPEDCRHVFAFCRNAPGDPALVRLKTSLSTRLFKENLLSYDANDLAKLCQDVERTLRTVIESEAAGFESRPALALEIEAHETFARERSLVFGREEVVKAITEYVRAGGGRTLVLQGASGSGKSAVMAQASERAGAALSTVLVRRFIGASPESSSGLMLLHSLCEQIGEAYAVAGELPADFHDVARIFRERLGLATVERPLVVFLDALDQLGTNDAARSLHWLVGILPPHCRIVASTTDVAPALDECQLLKLEVLPQADAATALDHWLGAAGRKLTPEQRTQLLAAFARCGLPLYLKLAFEEARGWTSYLPSEQCLLGDGVEGVIDTLLQRLSLQANHGPVLVESSLGYLAAARYGLTEDEILDVLASDKGVWQDFEENRNKDHDLLVQQLPVVVWSRLFLDLEPYLAERSAPGGTLTSFYHRQLAEQAAARFLGGEQRQKRHEALASYFGAQPHWFDAGQSRPNARKAAELIHQQLGAHQIDKVSVTLTDLQFVAAKCAAGLVFDLGADYSATMAVLPEARAELNRDDRQQERMKRWTRDITGYARAWSDRRERIADGLTPKSRGPVQPEIADNRMKRWAHGIIGHARRWSGRREGVADGLTPENREPAPPEIPDSVEPWNAERIAAECQRILQTPAPLDRLREFARFVEQENYTLNVLGGRPGFVVQHAHNRAPAGLLHALAEAQIGSVTAPMLLRQWPPEAVYNPKPALLRTLEGHKGPVECVSVIPDGRLAVSGSQDTKLRLWDLETGACLRTFGRGGCVSCVSTTPDGRHAVSGSYDKTLRLWDLETGACLRTLEGTNSVDSVSVTPDGRRAVCGSTSDNTLRVLDLQTGACLHTWEGQTELPIPWGINSVSMTPDGRRAVLAGTDQTLRVWDLETGACLHVLKGHTSAIQSVSVTPDGRRAVSTGWDETVRVWDLVTGTCLRTMVGHTFYVESVSMTPDGRRAVSAGRDQTVRVWDLETGECLRTLEGHSGMVYGVTVTPDGRRAVSASGDGTVRVWDLERSACQHTMERHTKQVNSVCTTPDGRQAVSGSQDRTIRVWDLETGACLRTIRGSSDILDINLVSVTPDGRRVVSGNSDNKLRVWDLNTGACLRTMEGHSSFVGCMSVAPDGRRVVSGSNDNTVRVWDLETGACLHILKGHTAAIKSVSVAPDGRRAVSGSIDCTLRVWDLETGACMHTLEGHSSYVEGLSLTPDGRRAVSESLDCTLRVWDLETGACLHTLEENTYGVDSVRVMPNGRQVVSGSVDGTLRLWDLETGECLRLAQGDNWAVTKAIRCMGLTQDGRLAVTGSNDKTLRVWDPASGRCLALERGDASWIALAIAGGDRLIVGGASGEVVVFRIRGIET